VTVAGGEFVLGCNKFPVSGPNAWEVMEASAGAPRLVGSNLPQGVGGPELIRDLLDTAARSGMTVVRAWWVTASVDAPEGRSACLMQLVQQAGQRCARGGGPLPSH
jgi:hypothetical protein